MINEYATNKILALWSSDSSDSTVAEMVQDVNISVPSIQNFIMIPDISRFGYRKVLRIQWIMEIEVPYFYFGKSFQNKNVHVFPSLLLTK